MHEPPILYDGPEGIVSGPGAEEDIVFLLNLGNGTQDGRLYPDGTIIYGRSHTTHHGSVAVHTRALVTMTPEEAEPYKAFLRSKGVTLPHVMP